MQARAELGKVVTPGESRTRCSGRSRMGKGLPMSSAAEATSAAASVASEAESAVETAASEAESVASEAESVASEATGPNNGC